MAKDEETNEETPNSNGPGEADAPTEGSGEGNPDSGNETPKEDAPKEQKPKTVPAAEARERMESAEAKLKAIKARLKQATVPGMGVPAIVTEIQDIIDG